MWHVAQGGPRSQHSLWEDDCAMNKCMSLISPNPHPPTHPPIPHWGPPVISTVQSCTKTPLTLTKSLQLSLNAWVWFSTPQSTGQWLTQCNQRVLCSIPVNFLKHYTVYKEQCWQIHKTLTWHNTKKKWSTAKHQPQIRVSGQEGAELWDLQIMSRGLKPMGDNQQRARMRSKKAPIILGRILLE